MMLPCLLFVSMATSIDVNQLYNFLSVVGFGLFIPFTGFLLGNLVVLLTSPPEFFKRPTVMAVTFGNAAFIPLSLTTVAVALKFSDIPNAEPLAVSYISIYVSIFSLIYWISAPIYMKGGSITPDIETPAITISVGSPTVNTDIDSVSTALINPTALVCSESVESKEANEGLTAVVGPIQTSTALPSSQSPLCNDIEVFFTILEGEVMGQDVNTHSVRSKGMVGVFVNLMATSPLTLRISSTLNNPICKSLRSVGKQIFSPPTIAVMCGVLVGFIEPLHWLFFGTPSSSTSSSSSSPGLQFIPFGFISSGMEMIGTAAVPCSMLYLGANLSEGPSSAKLPFRVTLGVIVAKLIVLPLLGVALVFALSHFHILPDDPVLKFVLMLEGATPSAMSLPILCQSSGCGGEKEMSSLQFYVYISSALTLTVLVSCILWAL